MFYAYSEEEEDIGPMERPLSTQRQEIELYQGGLRRRLELRAAGMS